MSNEIGEFNSHNTKNSIVVSKVTLYNCCI